DPDCPPTDAVTVVTPPATPVTAPFALTVATVVSALVHATVVLGRYVSLGLNTESSRIAVAPTDTETLVGYTWTAPTGTSEVLACTVCPGVTVMGPTPTLSTA